MHQVSQVAADRDDTLCSMLPEALGEKVLLSSLGLTFSLSLFAFPCLVSFSQLAFQSHVDNPRL